MFEDIKYIYFHRDFDLFVTMMMLKMKMSHVNISASFIARVQLPPVKRESEIYSIVEEIQ